MRRMSAGWLDSQLVQHWIPAVDGLAASLAAGGAAVDVGCGHGRASLVLGRAFPRARLLGIDTFGPNVATATAEAEAAGLAGVVEFRQVRAVDELPAGQDLVTCFDVLHDVADPAGLLRAAHAALRPGGTLLVLEAPCADHPEDNTGPAAALLYATSTLYCLPSSLAGGGPALGTLGLPATRLAELCGDAGFTAVRRLPGGSPFTAVYVATR
jgi:SAM-dependent methyltransferase